MSNPLRKLLKFKFILGCCLTVAVGAGCSSAPIDNRAASNAHKPAKEMPLPEANWVKETNIDHYKVFTTHDEAIAWFEEFKTGLAAKLHGNANDIVVPLGDPRYDVIESEIAVVWRAFVELFPRETAGLENSPPFVVLTTRTAPNAFAVYDPDLKLQPHAFVVQAGALESKNGAATTSQDALRGLIAHELAHYVLKHSWPKNEAKIARYYSIDTATGSGFGWEQADDESVHAIGAKYIELASATGDFPLRQWNGFNRANAQAEPVRAAIHDAAKKKDPTSCTAAEAKRAQLGAHALTMLSNTTMSVTATPAQLTKLDQLSKAYVAAEMKCADAIPELRIFGMIAKMTGKTEAAVRASSTPEELAAGNAASNAYDAVVRLTTQNDATLVKLDIANVRSYTFEEQADDVALNVLFRVGSDPHGLATFLDDVFLDEAGRAQCETLMSEGEPTYGILSDEHHSPCWRIWHANSLVTYLSTP